MSEFLNVRETARRLGVHENTVRNMQARGDLRCVRLPGSGYRRFVREDIERMRGEMLDQYAPATEMTDDAHVNVKGEPMGGDDA